MSHSNEEEFDQFKIGKILTKALYYNEKKLVIKFKIKKFKLITKAQIYFNK